MADVSLKMLERNGLTSDDLTWLIPHQANMRIIDATARRMGISKDQVMINISRYGNTTNATIPLCIWEWEDKLKSDLEIKLLDDGSTTPENALGAIGDLYFALT